MIPQIKKRIAKDYTVTWSDITTNGSPLSLQGRDITLVITNPMHQQHNISPLNIEDNSLSFFFSVAMQIAYGDYYFTLYENLGKRNQTVLDACICLTLVAASCMEDSSSGLDNDTIKIPGGNIVVGVKGDKGESAYQIAVNNGFVGSEQEWLQSLIGPPGDKMTFDDLTKSEIAALQEPARIAAEIANKEAEGARIAAATANAAAKEANSVIANISVTLTDIKETNDITI